MVKWLQVATGILYTSHLGLLSFLFVHWLSVTEHHLITRSRKRIKLWLPSGVFFYETWVLFIFGIY